MRRTLDHGECVGDEERAKLVGLPIGVHDGNRTAGLDLAHGVIGIGQPDGNLKASENAARQLFPQPDGRWISREPPENLAQAHICR